MNNLLALICILLFSLPLSGQIKVNSSFEIGYEDRFISITDNGKFSCYEFNNNIFTVFELSANYKGFNLYTDIKTYIEAISLVEYNPLLTQYKVGASYVIKNIELRYEHLCAHSIDKYTFHEGRDRVSVKVNLIN